MQEWRRSFDSCAHSRMFHQLKFVIRRVNCGCIGGVFIAFTLNSLSYRDFSSNNTRNEANRTIKVEWEFHHSIEPFTRHRASSYQLRAIRLTSYLVAKRLYKQTESPPYQ